MTLSADDPRHGTANGYGNLKCRCQPCRDAWAVYHRPIQRSWRSRQDKETQLAQWRKWKRDQRERQKAQR